MQLARKAQVTMPIANGRDETRGQRKKPGQQRVAKEQEVCTPELDIDSVIPKSIQMCERLVGHLYTCDDCKNGDRLCPVGTEIYKRAQLADARVDRLDMPRRRKKCKREMLM